MLIVSILSTGEVCCQSGEGGEGGCGYLRRKGVGGIRGGQTSVSGRTPVSAGERWPTVAAAHAAPQLSRI